MKVYVVTDTESGWDCVRAVCLTLDSLKEWYSQWCNRDLNLFKHFTLIEFETYVANGIHSNLVITEIEPI